MYNIQIHSWVNEGKSRAGVADSDTYRGQEGIINGHTELHSPQNGKKYQNLLKTLKTN